jgi:hypothetical protein
LKFSAPASHAKGLYLTDKPAVSRERGPATSGVRWCFVVSSSFAICLEVSYAIRVDLLDGVGGGSIRRTEFWPTTDWQQ